MSYQISALILKVCHYLCYLFHLLVGVYFYCTIYVVQEFTALI